MRRLTLLIVMAAGSLLVAAPAAAGPVPPPATGGLPVSSQPVFLLPIWFSGTGTQSIDGSITASGNFYNHPTLGDGTYAYDLGPPQTVPPEFQGQVPGDQLQSGTGTLTWDGTSQTTSLVCNPLVRTCVPWPWPVTEVGQPIPEYSKHHRSFIGRGGFFSEWGFFTTTCGCVQP